jgi:hypothetical protein
VEVGDHVRLKLGAKKNHFYADNWSSVVYKVESERKPQPLKGFPTQLSRHTFTVSNADDGELVLNRLGVPMLYGHHELLKIPTRDEEDEEDEDAPKYHAQEHPDLSDEEMRQICNSCIWDARMVKDAEEFVDPDDEVDADLVDSAASMAPTTTTIEDAVKALDTKLQAVRDPGSSEGRVRQYVELLVGLKGLLLENERIEDSPGWPDFRTKLDKKSASTIAEAYIDPVSLSLESLDEDYVRFDRAVKNTRNLKRTLKNYLAGGVIAPNFDKKGKRSIIRDVVPLGQQTVRKGLKQLNDPESVQVLSDGNKAGHFVYKFDSEKTADDDDDVVLYKFLTSDKQSIDLPVYWAARLALESVLFTPKNALGLSGKHIVPKKMKRGEVLPADDGVREKLHETFSGQADDSDAASDADEGDADDSDAEEDPV